MKNYQKILLFIIPILFVASFAFARDPIYNPGSGDGSTVYNPGANPTTNTLQNPLKNINSIGQAVSVAVQIFAYVAVLVGVLMLIWVGFQFVLAQGNSKRIGELKGYLLWIVIGIAIIIGARIIIQVVLTTLESTGVVQPDVIHSANSALNGTNP